MKNTYVYTYSAEENHMQFLYINLTNKCTNRCDFCIRNNKDGIGGGRDLWIDREPDADEISEIISSYNLNDFEEVVFCGYGEPTERLDTLIETAKRLKEKYNCKIRINTNGQANLIYKKDVTPLFEGIIDTVSVSLNASNAEDYDKICHSVFGKEAFCALLDFAAKAKKHVPTVLLSIVDIMSEEEKEKCRSLAEKAGCKLKIRPFVQD